MESTLPNRDYWVREAIVTMGVPIFGGAASTIGAASFLWFCQIVFFFKFAFVMTIVIASSFLMSMIMLPVLLHTIGPLNKDFASLKPIFNFFTVSENENIDEQGHGKTDFTNIDNKFEE